MTAHPRRVTHLAVCLSVVLMGAASMAQAAGLPAKPAPAPHASIFGDFYPPTPDLVVVRQPDGTVFKAALTYAEIGGALEVGGYSVTRRADGWWVYAAGRDGAGKLTPTAARVGLDTRPTGLPEGVGRTPDVWTGSDGRDARSQMFRQLQIASAKAQAQAAASGQRRIFRFPVLMLATWWDAEKGQTEPQFQDGGTAEKFQALLSGFGGNPRGTLTEFYLENSYNGFLVQVDVFGPFVSNRSRADRCYYGGIDASDDPTDDLDPTDNVLGVGGLGAVGMALEAVPQADPTVDFSVYDNDGDGYVDFLGMLHSGPDMAGTGDPCHTWSHALPVSAFGDIAEGLLGLPADTVRGGFPTSDGVLVDRVFTMPEVDFEIGVASHEMAHALGEPDYYNTNATSQGTGDWDIMAGGSWLGNPPGSNPTGFNPASRAFQGWLGENGAGVRLITDDTRGLTLQPRELQPDIVLVPVRTIGVGETDQYGHTWTANDAYGLVRDGMNRYVVEGYFAENWSRTANGPAIDPGMSRAPYFDRAAWSSGVMVWHFDYVKRSNVYFGANNAGSDPNRPQMDPMEFDWNDNTQELQLNVSRGDASDLLWGAATGITSGTRRLPPGVGGGQPQGPSSYSGTLAPTASADHPFVIEDNPANDRVDVSVQGLGDCKLLILRRQPDGTLTAVGDEADDGFAGDKETITIMGPTPGNYVARVGDFALCTQYQGNIVFSAASSGFITLGAADTWSNWTERATGWAFTNVGPAFSEGLDHSADGPGPEHITLDIVNFGASEADLSPGFARAADNAVAGQVPVVAGRANAMAVPIYNNGGLAVGSAGVEIRRDSPTGPRVAGGTISGLGAYSHKDFAFTFKPTGEGPYTLYVVVDPLGVVTEAHEANNAQRIVGWAGPAGPRVLVVDDDGIDGEDSYAGALAALGIPYAITRNHVDAATMRSYQAVIWETGLDRGAIGVLDEGDRAELAAYLDGGGKVFLSSVRAADSLAATPFLRQYFGVQFEDVLGIAGGFMLGTGDIFGDGVFYLDPFNGRPITDVFGAATEASGAVTPLGGWYYGDPAAPMGELALRVDGNFQTAFLGANLSQLVRTDDMIDIVGAVMSHFGIVPGGYSASSPRIFHTDVRHRVSGHDTPIRAMVTGLKPSDAVTLYYRHHGIGSYVAVPMTRGSRSGSYQATIPGRDVTPDGVDYYIKAGSVTDPRGAAGKQVTHVIGVALPEP
jgi:M6 family metalloprotease-like protein